jgi:hypothetical protein
MTSFNTGNQQAGNINMVGGNQFIQGGQCAYTVAPPEVLAALETLRRHLAELLPDPAERAKADRELHHLDQGLAAGHVTKTEAANLLSRIVDAAQATGTIVSAATKAGAAVTALAHWLGPAGAALTHMIH